MGKNLPLWIYTLNGNYGTAFICRNRAFHTNKKNYSFTIKFKQYEMNLKKYLMEYIDIKFYNHLQEIHKKAKKSKENYFHKDTIQSCLTIGLNQTIISKIFCVNQTTISRYIKDKGLIKSTNKSFVTCKCDNNRIFYSRMLIDQRLEKFLIDE